MNLMAKICIGRREARILQDLQQRGLRTRPSSSKVPLPNRQFKDLITESVKSNSSGLDGGQICLDEIACGAVHPLQKAGWALKSY